MIIIMLLIDLVLQLIGALFKLFFTLCIEIMLLPFRILFGCFLGETEPKVKEKMRKPDYEDGLIDGMILGMDDVLF